MSNKFFEGILAAFPSVASQTPDGRKPFLERILEYVIQKNQQPQADQSQGYDTGMASPKGRRRAQYSPSPVQERTLAGSNTPAQSMLGGGENLLGG